MTLPQTQKQWLINGNPRGRALSEDDFLLQEAPLQALQPGQVRVRVEYLGFDPSQKGQIEHIEGYSRGAGVGDVMGARGIGEVVESAAEQMPIGTKVIGPIGWQQYANLGAEVVEQIPADGPTTAWLGPLGGTGLTAYFGLLRIGRPEPGDTVVVSGAAGAVGSVAGQIAKIMGCRTIGIAGGAQKCQWLVDEVGYDAAIDYKSERIKTRLGELCPDGVDVFFDNVGGAALNDTLARIAHGARVVICGGISRYEQESLPPDPPNYFNMVFREATMQGFLLTSYTSEFAQAQRRILSWIDSGQLVYKEDVQAGFENIPKTLLRLFRGENFGKQLLRV